MPPVWYSLRPNRSDTSGVWWLVGVTVLARADDPRPAVLLQTVP